MNIMPDVIYIAIDKDKKFIVCSEDENDETLYIRGDIHCQKITEGAVIKNKLFARILDAESTLYALRQAINRHIKAVEDGKTQESENIWRDEVMPLICD